MLTRLLKVDPSIFRRIALFTIFDAEFPTPLCDFLNLSLVCRAAHKIFTDDSGPLYFEALAATFDILGPLNRLGKAVVEEHAEHELKRRFAALKVLRKGLLDDPSLTEAFWIAYLMFEDSDKGHKNVKHLLASGLTSLCTKFLRHRLYLGSETNHGWPIPNEQNSLAVALLWLSTSSQSLRRESSNQHNEIACLLHPLVFAAFRYPIFSTAEFCFEIATYIHQPTASSVHGPYPPPPLFPHPVVYFGPVSRRIRVPSISLFAALSFFARSEMKPPALPPHLLPENRLNITGPQTGPTLADIKYFNEHCQTHFADFEGIDVGGAIRGRLNTRPNSSIPTSVVEPSPYMLGCLTGKWQGSFILPFLNCYKNWLTTLNAPPHFEVSGRSPLYMTLQEYYVCGSDVKIPLGKSSEGMMNAWLPAGLIWRQRENGLEVTDEKGSFKSFYHAFQRGHHFPSGHVSDIIITGRTDPQHATAWGNHEIIGRIRLEDGLVVLSRKPLSEDSGTNLLRGYALSVTSSQNFVGRFKGVSDGTEPSAWEGVFSLCQVRQA